MAYSDVVSRRLEKLIERLVGQEIDISGDPRLEDPPLGFNSQGLAELRSRINGNDGFADVLSAVIPASEMKASMRFSALVALIVQRSSLQALPQYEAKQRERVRLGLRRILSEMSPTPVAPDDVLPTDMIATYLPANQGALISLRDRLNQEFQKYLITDIRLIDLNGTVRRANELIVARMLA